MDPADIFAAGVIREANDIRILREEYEKKLRQTGGKRLQEEMAKTNAALAEAATMKRNLNLANKTIEDLTNAQNDKDNDKEALNTESMRNLELSVDALNNYNKDLEQKNEELEEDNNKLKNQLETFDQNNALLQSKSIEVANLKEEVEELKNAANVAEYIKETIVELYTGLKLTSRQNIRLNMNVKDIEEQLCRLIIDYINKIFNRNSNENYLQLNEVNGLQKLLEGYAEERKKEFDSKVERAIQVQEKNRELTNKISSLKKELRENKGRKNVAEENDDEKLRRIKGMISKARSNRQSSINTRNRINKKGLVEKFRF